MTAEKFNVSLAEIF